MNLDLSRLDRRVVYLLVLLALSIPLIQKFSLPAAKMYSAEKAFALIDKLRSPLPHSASAAQLVLVVMDFGPNSMAENLPQSEVLIEHLMRRRIPFAVMSQYTLAEPFLNSVPQSVAARLQKEMPHQRWDYGSDWVNLGYRPGGAIMVQNIARSDNIADLLKKDARGNSLSDLSVIRDIKTLDQIPVLIQLTSLVGTLDVFLQFFKRQQFRPAFLHGCTSITIPNAFIYLDSGQLRGLLEGIAGAAWYSTLLKKEYPERGKDTSMVINTALGVAHLVIIALVILGNVAGRRKS